MNEFDRAYRALAQEADTVALAAPGALRARADRRTRLRVTAAAVAAAVAVGGAAVGTQWVLRADGSAPPPVPPGATGSATPPPPTSAPPTSAPPSPAATTPPATRTPTTPPERQIPRSIPNSAFLQDSDVVGDHPVTDSPSENFLPDLCGATFDTERYGGLRRSRHIVYWKATTPAGSTPDGSFTQTITTYDPDRASGFLEDVREAVAA